MTSTTFGIDELAALPTEYSVFAKNDRKRYQKKFDEEATDYKYAVVTFIPRQRVALKQNESEKARAQKAVEQRGDSDATSSSRLLRTCIKDAMSMLEVEMVADTKKDVKEGEDKVLHDGLEQAWRLLRDTLAPEKNHPRIMMMKIRDVFRTKEEAVTALHTYFKPHDPHFDHMWVEIGAWDGFLDEDNALNMKMVNKDMYSSSHSIFQQVMAGWFQSIDNDRKGLEFRLWKDSAKTDMWRRLSRIKNTTGHEAPDETLKAITEGKTMAQADKETERQSLSESRVNGGGGGQGGDDMVSSSESLFAQLANLTKHKKRSMESFRRRRQQRKHV